MIALLRGMLLEKHPNQVIVDVGGVGYEVMIPVSTYSALAGSRRAKCGCASTRTCGKTLWRSSASCLQDEKALFEKLITVSGIGPKLAIKVLCGHGGAGSDRTRSARGEVEQLVRIPGVGKKTAERMVLELRDKLPAPAGDEPRSRGAQPSAFTPSRKT